MELLAWGNTVMEPHLFRIAPQSGSGESYHHEGEEFLYILQGELQISLEGEEYHLQPGDSFYFESATPHSWKNRAEPKPGCCGSTRRLRSSRRRMQETETRQATPAQRR